MSDEAVLNMPIRRFWYMYSYVDRIKASDLKDAIPLVQCAMGGDGVKQFADSLTQRKGTVNDVRPVEFVKTSDEDKQKLEHFFGKGKK